jgi:hypothetical protein
VPVIWQNCLSVDSVPVIWHTSSLHVEKHASDLAEMLVPVIWQNCLSVDTSVTVILLNSRIVCLWRSVTVILLNIQYVEEHASDLA